MTTTRGICKFTFIDVELGYYAPTSKEMCIKNNNMWNSKRALKISSLVSVKD